MAVEWGFSCREGVRASRFRSRVELRLIADIDALGDGDACHGAFALTNVIDMVGLAASCRSGGVGLTLRSSKSKGFSQESIFVKAVFSRGYTEIVIYCVL